MILILFHLNEVKASIPCSFMRDCNDIYIYIYIYIYIFISLQSRVYIDIYIYMYCFSVETLRVMLFAISKT